MQIGILYLSKNPPDELEDFLIENFYYHLFDNDTFFRDVLFEEMQNLVKQTHNYKKLTQYLEKQES